MALLPFYVINAIDLTAQLQIFLSGVLTTTYNFDNGFVTISERKEITTGALSDLEENINNIDEWIILIQDLLKHPIQSRSYFEEEMIKNVNGITAKIDVLGENLSNLSFNSINKIITFQARNEIQVTFSDFFAWKNFLRRFYNECINF